MHSFGDWESDPILDSNDLKAAGRKKDAANVFTRMLWLNPGDNQGARFNLEQVQRGLEWRPEDE